MKGWGLPGEAKKSQRNLGLLVASGDLILFANSIAKKKKKKYTWVAGQEEQETAGRQRRDKG